MDNYKAIEASLDTHDNFRGNSLMGIRRDTTAGTQYEVYSYSTLIANYNLATGEAWINPKKYSVTTSRAQNLIRKVWGLI